jgi:site-specific recombinase XerD
MVGRRIKNVNYRKFLDDGYIKILSEADINKALLNVKGKNLSAGRSLLIILYFTGCRPVEALNIKAKDLKKEGNYIIVQLKGSKRGLPRPVYLPLKNPMIKELYDYSLKCYPEVLLFYSFRNNYLRTSINKKGDVRTRNEITDKLRYYMRLWFDNVIEGGIPPYYLRHNRFSKLAQKDASLESIRQLKGSRTLNSVMPYLHLSSKTAKEIGRKLD